jgi:hypothetical protein
VLNGPERYIDGERFYDVGGRLVPSVTTRLNRLHKRGLQQWLLANVAHHVATHPELIIRAANREHAWEAVKATDNANKGPATKGSAVHDLVAQLEAGVPMEKLPPLASYWLRSYVDLKAQEEWDVVRTEFVVVNDTLGYAGRVDLSHRYRRGTPAGTVLGDLKTGKLFPDQALQLAAYANAERTLEGDPLPEDLRRDVGALIHLPDSGQPSVRFVMLQRPWAAFRALCFVDDVLRTLEPDVWGESLELEHVPGQGDLLALLEASVRNVQASG